ncbi:MAG: preprotein translocase subunit Tim44 [Novosphingobium sp. 28-62-57]|nr:MAG: preprotein translocase subunit Tim44 [Novosphingobium sp. 12-62-10]OYZ09324.1 MAG: preprotein translocase subunit Tim44 [Novosphingobium sp. 28-62-57]OZA39153.1 MAG: preprotein translocase subunit Tim44 [Novosphingobium sp. 17-62-9]
MTLIVQSGRAGSIGNLHVIVQIVILAMIAAFLGLRLYSVLGRRPEHDEEPMRRRIEQPDPSSQNRQPPVSRGAEGGQLAPRPRDLAQPEPNTFDNSAEAGVRAIIAADRRFDLAQFLAGSKAAYAMVLEAFWRGDKEELRQLCDDDVYAGFEAAIDARVAAGEAITARVIRIEEARIVAASIEAKTARITVRFLADIASVTRDAEGHVIAGSLDDAVETRDLWTFRRDITARDPDWLLDETDEA